MRRKIAVSLLVLVPALVAAVGFAADSGLLSFNQPRGAMPIAGGSTGEPSTGGFSSQNVEYEGFLAFEEGGGLPGEIINPAVPANPEILTATGANIRGDYLYLTSWKNISIYDISEPLNPRLTDIEPIGFMFENENVATNGEILL